MFTGIIQGLGVLRERRGGSLAVEVPSTLREQLAVGASIAVNGVCLTVGQFCNKDTFLAELSPETASRSTLGEIRVRTRVNLELPMPAQGRFDGHLVLGHVDAVGRVKAITPARAGWRLMVAYPPLFRPYMAEKGSVAVDGISLTPFTITQTTFCCAIIPKTFETTNLQDRVVGDPMNLEFDILAKYVEGMMRHVHSN